MNFTKYDKYKETDLDWLEEIPENWEIRRVKDLGKALIGITYSPTDLVDEDSGILVLRASNIQNGRIDFSDNVYVNTKVPDKLIVKSGDILICSRSGSRSLIGKNICIDVNSAGHTFGAFMTVFRTKNFRFVSKFFGSELFDFQSGAFMTSTINQLTIGTLYNLLIAVPDKNEQKAIAEYLDEKTAQIDKKIELLQAKKEKYQELRKTLINEAVTKGIDKNVELKDSGVEWLGKIPKHWKVVRSKSLFENVSVKNHPNEKLLSVYRDYGVIEKDSRDDNHNRASDDLSNYKFVKNGYLVINKMKAWQGSVGISNYNGIVSPAYLTLKPIVKGHNFYFHYLLRCTACITEFQKFSYGVRPDQWDLRYNDFADFMLAVPAIEEQKRIAEYLNEKTSKIDEIILTIDKNIEVLNEFRKTLINDAVTGKIKIAPTENNPYDRNAVAG